MPPMTSMVASNSPICRASLGALLPMPGGTDDSRWLGAGMIAEQSTMAHADGVLRLHRSSSARFPVQVLDYDVRNRVSCPQRTALTAQLRYPQLHLVRAPFQGVLLHHPLQGIQ